MSPLKTDQIVDGKELEHFSYDVDKEIAREKLEIGHRSFLECHIFSWLEAK